MRVERMLDEIRKLIGLSDASEEDTLEVLLDEAECWKARLKELKEDDDDGE